MLYTGIFFSCSNNTVLQLADKLVAKFYSFLTVPDHTTVSCDAADSLFQLDGGNHHRAFEIIVILP